MCSSAADRQRVAASGAGYRSGMTAVAIVVAVVVLMFVLGLLVPRISRRAQGKEDRALLRGEAKGDRNAGALGDAAEGGMKLIRRAGDRSAEAGRKVHRKVTPG